MVILGQEPKAYFFRAISHALDIYLEGNISRNMTIRIGKIPSEKSIKVRWRKDTDVGAEFNNTLNNKIYTTIVKSME